MEVVRLTWFITEYDDSKIGTNKFSIVGVDEFRNDAYLSELNRGKPFSVSYSMFEDINPCKGFNDGSYYVNAGGEIGWRSCELLQQPLLQPLKPIVNIGYEGDRISESDGPAILGVRKGGNSVIRITAPDGYVILPDLKKQVEIAGDFSVANDHTFLLRKV